MADGSLAGNPDLLISGKVRGLSDLFKEASMESLTAGYTTAFSLICTTDCRGQEFHPMSGE